MTPERWREVKTVFQAALERSPGERPAFLDAACGTDAALRQEVESLLAVEGAAGFLEPPSARATALAGEGQAQDAGVLAALLTEGPGRPELAERLQAALGGAYRIERELGGGGMSRVFVALETALGRKVVVKVLPPGLGAALDIQRFRREVRLAASLRHPHIVPLHVAGESPDGLVYYTMPFIEGASLKRRLEQERSGLPLPEAVRILKEVADALAYAHRQGVVHRDVKPANILVEEGHALVTDFGIAKALAAAAEGSPDGAAPDAMQNAGPADTVADQSATLTSTGLALGTPGYMAPEQVARDPAADHRVDLYALGCLAYHLLSGRTPFVGSSVSEVLEAHLADAPEPVVRHRSELPPELERLVMRLLAKHPSERPQTADEVLRELDLMATSAPRGRPHRVVSRRAAALLGGAAALVAVAVVGFSLRPSTPPAAMATRQVTFTGKVTEPALSPDARSVAYVSGNRSLVVERLDGGEPLVLVPPARRIHTPRWTSDGQDIVFRMFRDSSELPATWMVSSAGGPAHKVLEDWLAFDAGPDSRAVVRAPREKQRFELVDLRTGKSVREIPLPDSLSELRQVAWSPDGRLLAFRARGWVWTMPATGGSPRRVASGWNVRWSAAADAIYFVDGAPGGEALFRLEIDHRSGAGRDAPIRLASLPNVGAFDIRADRLVYTLQTRSAHARAFAFGESPRRVVEDRLLTEGTARVAGATISPDGKWIAYSQARGDDENVYVVPFEGGQPRPIAATSASESRPRWSPDGSRLAFTRVNSGAPALMIADVASGAAQRAGSAPGPANSEGLGYGLWSADGSRIAYFAESLRRIVVVDLERQTEREVPIPDSIGSGFIAAIPSPNGSRLLVSTLVRRTDWGELWFADLAGERWTKTRSPFGESWPLAWRIDGWILLENNRVLQTDYGALRLELWRMRGLEGKPEFYAPIPEGCAYGVDLSRDGTRAACTSVRTESDLFLATGFDPHIR